MKAVHSRSRAHVLIAIVDLLRFATSTKTATLAELSLAGFNPIDEGCSAVDGKKREGVSVGITNYPQLGSSDLAIALSLLLSEIAIFRPASMDANDANIYFQDGKLNDLVLNYGSGRTRISSAITLSEPLSEPTGKWSRNIHTGDFGFLAGDKSRGSEKHLHRGAQ